MEVPSIESPPVEITAPVVAETPVQQPAQVVTPNPVVEKKSLKDIFPSQIEWLTIGLTGLVAASYIMSIYYYRKAIQASSSMMKLQEQIDDIKIALKKPQK
jgi:hypothetical protein